MQMLLPTNLVRLDEYCNLHPYFARSISYRLVVNNTLLDQVKYIIVDGDVC
jgi:hypothetical protein